MKAIYQKYLGWYDANSEGLQSALADASFVLARAKFPRMFEIVEPKRMVIT